MRRLVQSVVLVACLAACTQGGQDILLDETGPFGGIYKLRQLNEAAPPLYFSSTWYPGRGISANVQSSTLMSADLTVRPDGSFTWSTLLEEVASKPGSYLPEIIILTTRREASGTWSYTASTGAVSLQGTDQTGAYVLNGSVSGNGLTLSSTFTTRVNSTFVLER